MIIIQQIVLILQEKRNHCKACMYESSAKVPKYLDCGLLLDPMYHGGGGGGKGGGAYFTL